MYFRYGLNAAETNLGSNPKLSTPCFVAWEPQGKEGEVSKKACEPNITTGFLIKALNRAVTPSGV